MSTRIVVLLSCLVIGIASAPTVQAQSKCDAIKIKEAGKKVFCKAKVHAKAVKKNEPLDMEKLTKCEAKFETKCGKGEEQGDCAAGQGTCAALEEVADQCVGDLLGESAPPATTTTTTASPTTTTSSSTTSTTLDPNAFVCCELGGDPAVCGQGITFAECTAEGWTPVPGAVCDGTGHCVSPPGTPGCCCQLPASLCSGADCCQAADLDEAGCLSSACEDPIGGVLHPAAVCQIDGTCQ